MGIQSLDSEGLVLRMEMSTQISIINKEGISAHKPTVKSKNLVYYQKEETEDE